MTLAELAAGPHATADPAERARRQDRLQRTESMFDPVPFDAACARAYGRIYAAVAASGRKARGRRVDDLLIAATALGVGLPLYTCNPGDFARLEEMLDIVRGERESGGLAAFFRARPPAADVPADGPPTDRPKEVSLR